MSFSLINSQMTLEAMARYGSGKKEQQAEEKEVNGRQGNENGRERQLERRARWRVEMKYMYTVYKEWSRGQKKIKEKKGEGGGVTAELSLQ